MKSSLLATVAMVGWLAATTVFAQVPVSEPQTYPAERLRLTGARSGLIDVEWAGVGRHLSWDLGVWLGYAKNPLVLYDLTTGKRLGSLVNDRIGLTVVGSLALFDWVEVGVELPFILRQARPATQTAVDGTLATLSSVGLGDLHVAPKVRILNQEDFGVGVAFVMGLSFPTGGARAYHGEKGVVFLPEFAVSRSFGGFRLGANVGATIRPGYAQTVALNESIDSEITGRLGAGYRFEAVPLEVDLSYFLAFSAPKPFAQANQTPMELRAQVAWSPISLLEIFVGGGVGLSRGWGTPDYRMFGGVRVGQWVDGPRPPDRDGDGLGDEVDKCPDTPENFNGFEDEDGCPDDPDPDRDGILGATDKCPNQSEIKNGYLDDDGCPDDPDPDRDGILGAADACPTQPEDKDGFQDEDGCPDPDNDSDGVLDTADKCPMVKGPAANLGCPDQDRDGDSVVDRLDNCPDEAGTAQTRAAGRGSSWS